MGVVVIVLLVRLLSMRRREGVAAQRLGSGLSALAAVIGEPVVAVVLLVRGQGDKAVSLIGGVATVAVMAVGAVAAAADNLGDTTDQSDEDVRGGDPGDDPADAVVGVSGVEIRGGGVVDGAHKNAKSVESQEDELSVQSVARCHQREHNGCFLGVSSEKKKKRELHFLLSGLSS